MTLEEKIEITKARIREWYIVNDGKVHVSFSGGKDSTALLDIVRSIFPDVKAVFVDTGLEYPEIKQFVKSYDNVEILKPKMNFKEVLKKYGYPLVSKEVSNRIYYYRKGSKWAKEYFEGTYGVTKYNNPERYQMTKWKPLADSDIPISDYCCYVMKKNPLKEYEHNTKSCPILGTMTDESQRRTTAWLQTGCNSFNSKRPMSKPLSFWTEQDIYKYILQSDLKICSVYGDIVPVDNQTSLFDENIKLKTTGCYRTGCIFCGFGCHLEKEPNRFQMLKQTHPKLWEYCMKPMDEGGLGMKEVLEFINVKTE